MIVESKTALDIYRMLLDRKIDLVTFASAAAILEFAAKYGADQVADLLSHTAVAIVGPAAHDAAMRANLTPAIHLASGTTAAFVEAIAAHFRGSNEADGSRSREPGAGRCFSRCLRSPRAR